MENTVKDIIYGNLSYVREVNKRDLSHLREGQKPLITCITCSDSRVSSHMFGKDTINYMFNIKNIGNQLSTSFGSVSYGIMHLHTPVLLIVGHTGCGAVSGCLGDYSEEPDEIKRELCSLTKHLSEVYERTHDKNYCAQANVDYQVRLALEKYRDYVEQRKLIIIGAMYDIHNVYGSNFGELYLVNFNGNTDVEELKKIPYLRKMDEEVRHRKVRRLHHNVKRLTKD